MKSKYLKCLGAVIVCMGLVSVGTAQNTPAPAQAEQSGPPQVAAAAPSPLSTPSITGPLLSQPPAMFNAGPFGDIAVNGVLSGGGLWQSNHIPGDSNTQAALTNGQVFIQKTNGWFQFYIQAGAYDIISLGLPFLPTDKTITDLYGPVPVAYLKLQASKNTSFEIGSLPTLIGAEYTFSFENMNIERGLLWNQENAVTKGIQVNQTMGKFTASLAWTDGFYSNRYTWLSGSLAYANGPHAISFVAGGNYDKTAFQTYATPVQNNSSIYNVIYTYTKGPWIIQPYYQYTTVPTNRSIGSCRARTPMAAPSWPAMPSNMASRCRSVGSISPVQEARLRTQSIYCMDREARAHRSPSRPLSSMAGSSFAETLPGCT